MDINRAKCLLVRIEEHEKHLASIKKTLLNTIQFGESEALTTDCSAEETYAQSCEQIVMNLQMQDGALHGTIQDAIGIKNAAWEAYWDCMSP